MWLDTSQNQTGPITLSICPQYQISPKHTSSHDCPVVKKKKSARRVAGIDLPYELFISPVETQTA